MKNAGKQLESELVPDKLSEQPIKLSLSESRFPKVSSAELMNSSRWESLRFRIGLEGSYEAVKIHYLICTIDGHGQPLQV